MEQFKLVWCLKVKFSCICCSLLGGDACSHWWEVETTYKTKKHSGLRLKCSLLFHALNENWSIYRLLYVCFRIILSRVRGSVTNNNGFWIGWLDLLTLIHLQRSGLQAIVVLSLFYTLSVHCCTHTLGFSVFTGHILAMDLSQLWSLQLTHYVFLAQFNSFLTNSKDSTEFSSQYCSVLLQLLNCQFQFSLISLAQSQSESYVMTDGQSASLSWCQAPIWGLRPDF
jgi:hypothetical protein